MIKDENQKQCSGDNSTNYQAHGNINIVNNYSCINKEDLHNELLLIFKENIPVLRKIAQDEALNRAEELNDNFIDKISQLEESLLHNMTERLSEPDMQIAIYEAQKNYAKYKSEDKLEQFTNLLLSKGLEKASSVRNYLLDEAIITISKMNQTQIDFLSYLLRKFTKIVDVTKVSDLHEKYIKKILIHSYVLDVATYSDVDYLDQIGCIKRRPYKIVDQTLIDILKKQYQNINNAPSSLTQLDPNINSLFAKDANLPSIDLTPLGILIGLKNIEIKTGDILNWNF